MLTLYDAARCPYCARVRILLAEKEIPYETVEIDLENRPVWLYKKNSVGRVPVLVGGETPEALDAELAKLDAALAASPYLAGSQFSQADVAYVPWIMRAEGRAGVDLNSHENLRGWLGRLIERRSIAAELEVVAAMAP